jgi:hypothetical protein
MNNTPDMIDLIQEQKYLDETINSVKEAIAYLTNYCKNNIGGKKSLNLLQSTLYNLLRIIPAKERILFYLKGRELTCQEEEEDSSMRHRFIEAVHLREKCSIADIVKKSDLVQDVVLYYLRYFVGRDFFAYYQQGTQFYFEWTAVCEDAGN